MEIKIDFTKSAQENADEYYTRSKRLALKRDGAERAIAELRKRLEAIGREEAKGRVITKAEKREPREWYEKFHWFFTSDGLLVIGGKDAHQNEALNSKHFESNDLFFHANIFGASPMILKGGAASPRGTREEVAQFAACYSSAWKDGLGAIDVYAMGRDQVSKSTSKGSLGTGSFLLSGERDWYRGVQLALVMLVMDGKLVTLPPASFAKSAVKAGKHVLITLGKDKKSDAAKRIAKILGYGDIDYIMQQLPAGSFKVEEK